MGTNERVEASKITDHCLTNPFGKLTVGKLEGFELDTSRAYHTIEAQRGDDDIYFVLVPIVSDASEILANTICAALNNFFEAQKLVE